MATYWLALGPTIQYKWWPISDVPFRFSKWNKCREVWNLWLWCSMGFSWIIHQRNGQQWCCTWFYFLDRVSELWLPCYLPFSLMLHRANNIYFRDNSPHTDDPKPDWPVILTALKNVTNTLQEHFPNVTIFPILGNHDVFPKDFYPSNSSELYNQYLT